MPEWRLFNRKAQRRPSNSDRWCRVAPGFLYPLPSLVHLPAGPIPVLFNQHCPVLYTSRPVLFTPLSRRFSGLTRLVYSTYRLHVHSGFFFSINGPAGGSLKFLSMAQSAKGFYKLLWSHVRGGTTLQGMTNNKQCYPDYQKILIRMMGGQT